MSTLTAASELDMIQSPEAFVANQILPDRQWLKNSASEAYDTGLISVEQVADNVQGGTYLYVRLSQEDLAPDVPRNFTTGGTLSALVGDNPSEATQVKIAEQVKKGVVDSLALDASWYEKLANLGQELGPDNIRQTAFFTFGDHTIPLINFSDTELTQDHLVEMYETVGRMAKLSNGALFTTLEGIALQSADRFGKTKKGTPAMGYNITGNVVSLNEKLLDPVTKRGKFGEWMTTPLSPVKEVLTHELWHSIQPFFKNRSDKPELDYDSALGYMDRRTYLTDDLGNMILKSQGIVPSEGAVVTDDYGQEVSVEETNSLRTLTGLNPITYVRENGGVTEKNTREHFGHSIDSEVRLPTEYAGLKGEDDADSSVIYTYPEYFKEGALDRVRSHMFDTILDEVKPQDPENFEGTWNFVEPQEYKNALFAHPLKVKAHIRGSYIPPEYNTNGD